MYCVENYEIMKFTIKTKFIALKARERKEPIQLILMDVLNM